jgi:hypothetical protein
MPFISTYPLCNHAIKFEIFGDANFITEYKLVYVLRCRSTNRRFPRRTLASLENPEISTIFDLK